MTVAVNPPKTPVTAGSKSIAMATLPNICKMPGPPAPFVPTPLPNIGKSDNSPQGYSTTVTIAGDAVAIKGATFNSMGDVASQGTGGGIVSNNVQGPTSFIGPGSLDVTIEGKAVQFLGDQMLNNCGPSGSPANAATMQGVVHAPGMPVLAQHVLQDIVCKCDAECDQNASPTETCRALGERKHSCCDKAIQQHNAEGRQPKLGGEQGYNKSTGQPVSTPRMQLIGEPYFPDYVKRISGKMFPDAQVQDEFGRTVRFVEFKFQCPAGTPTRAGAGPSLGTANPTWTPGKNSKPGQLEKTIALGEKQDPPVSQKPLLVTNTACP